MEDRRARGPEASSSGSNASPSTKSTESSATSRTTSSSRASGSIVRTSAWGDPVMRGGAGWWLCWFAIAVVVGMQAGTIFKPLGSVGDTRVADWIDLAVPFAILGCAVMMLSSAGAARSSWVVMFLGGVAFALGHGLHLAANSISNVADTTVADASIVHLWDEVASHYIWYSGLYLVLVALWVVLSGRPIRIRPVGAVLGVLVAITLVNTYIEGGVPWLGLTFLATGIAAGLTRPRTPAGQLALLIGGIGFTLLLGWGLAWYVADGTIFPEFSDVGWI